MSGRHFGRGVVCSRVIYYYFCNKFYVYVLYYMYCDVIGLGLGLTLTLTLVKERLKSSLRKFYGRYGDLTKQYEVPLSRMLHDILDDDHIQ